MAESVDALVSNTSGATRAGSTPALGTEAQQALPCRQQRARDFFVLFLCVVMKILFIFAHDV